MSASVSEMPLVTDEGPSADEWRVQAQDQMLIEGVRGALRARRISDADDAAVSMLCYAAVLAPNNQKFISATRLFLGALESARSGEPRPGSQIAALSAVVGEEKQFAAAWPQVRSRYRLQSAKEALERLQSAWFATELRRLIDRAADNPSDRPLSDAIMRDLLRIPDRALRSRFGNLNGLARAVDRKLGLKTIEFAPNVWVFLAIEGQHAANFAADLAPGRIFFWRHNSLFYTRQMKVGDTVIVLIGASGGRGNIIATGILAADASMVFTDTNQAVRRYPVLCIDAFQKTAIDRGPIERTAGPLVRNQGAVHPVTVQGLEAINTALVASHPGRALPIAVDAANAALKTGESIRSALSRFPHIRPDEKTDTALKQWPPVIPTRNAESPAAVEEQQPDSDLTLDQFDSRVPFTTDAPSVADTLGRGPLAFFLARRLHLIWCELNDCAPGSKAGREARAPQMRDPDETFIVHIDSPWGGGKTTFANFVARTLNPVGERLDEDHFLWSVVGSTRAAEGQPAARRLDEVFFINPEASEEKRERWPKRARKPWIIASYNAWQEQSAQPPWWHIFLTLQRTLIKESWSPGMGFSRFYDWRWWRSIAFRGRILGRGLRYKLLNSKIRTQLVVVLLALVSLAVMFLTGVINHLEDWSTQTKVSPTAIFTSLGIALSALLTIIAQSLVPEVDFSAESRQIGVGNPINRFQKAFQRLLEIIDRPVLLIVDDIDRCDPRNAVEILRGFQTIIRSPRLFVLVLGDRSWIEKAHEIYHKDFSGLNVGTEAKLGERFVEKIFQLSFRLPAMAPDAIARYTQAVLTPRQRSEMSGGLPATQVGDTPRTGTGDIGIAGQAQAFQAEQQNEEPATREGPTDPREAEIEQVTREAGEEITRIAELSATIQEREARIRDAVVRAVKRGVRSSEIEKIASIKMVAASGSDIDYIQDVTNALLGLVASLPGNPRQIKRIFNAFAVYDGVGRIMYNYQMRSDGSEEQNLRARRWWQLAKWVVLATEWPTTWRAVACQPQLLDAAYLEDEGAREEAMNQILAELQDEEQKNAARAVRRRLVQSPWLNRLLSHPDQREWNASRQEESEAIPAITDVGMEREPIYQFNRILWEPGFPLTVPEVQSSAPVAARS